jgi:hypothetical protein
VRGAMVHRKTWTRKLRRCSDERSRAIMAI